MFLSTLPNQSSSFPQSPRASEFQSPMELKQAEECQDWPRLRPRPASLPPRSSLSQMKSFIVCIVILYYVACSFWDLGLYLGPSPGSQHRKCAENLTTGLARQSLASVAQRVKQHLWGPSTCVHRGKWPQEERSIPSSTQQALASSQVAPLWVSSLCDPCRDVIGIVLLIPRCHCKVYSFCSRVPLYGGRHDDCSLV